MSENDEQRERAPGTGGASLGADAAQPGPAEARAETTEVEPEVVDAEVVGDEAGDEREATEPESELELALRERAEYLDLAQRARADLDNYRRRVSAESGAAELRGKAAVARNLIPALDNLERALLAAGVDPSGEQPEERPTSEEASPQTALAEGVALVYRELAGGLQRAGIAAFDPAGERFDPVRHEAITTADSETAETGTVLETLERGYELGDQVLRPARVVVCG